MCVSIVFSLRNSRARDLAVGQALRDELCDLALPRAQRVEPLGTRGAGAATAHAHPGPAQLQARLVGHARGAAARCLLARGRQQRDRRLEVGGQERAAGHEPVAGRLERRAGRVGLRRRRQRELGGVRGVAVGQGHERLGPGGRRPRARHPGHRGPRGRALPVLAGGGQVVECEVALHEVRRPAADPAVVDLVGRQEVAAARVLAAGAQDGAEDRARDGGRGRVVERGRELDALARPRSAPRRAGPPP